MKDKNDKGTADLLRSPEAARQASFAERQRAMGRKQFKRWASDEEAAAMDALLKGMRLKK